MRTRSCCSNASRGGMAMKSCEGTKHALLPPIRMSALVAAMKRSASWFTSPSSMSTNSGVRRHGIAVIVVHHAKKGAGHVRAGQALRGSSEFPRRSRLRRR